MNRFYVYAHLNPMMVPFYIGKGTLQRAHSLTEGHRNKWHARTVKKYGSENIIIEVMSCSSEEEAYLREKLTIKSLRKAGVVLCNMTDGGEGGNGELWRLSIKKAMSTPEARLLNSATKKGLKKSPAHCLNMSIANIGKVHSKETREKQSRGIKSSLAKPEIRIKMGIKNNKHRLGDVASPATRAKMALSQRLRWAKRKQGERL